MLEEPADPRVPDRTPLAGSGFARLTRTWLPIAAAAGLITIVALASRTTPAASPSMSLDLEFIVRTIEVVVEVAAIVGFLVVLPVVMVMRAQQRRRLAVSAPARQPAPWWAQLAGLALTLAIIAAQIAIVAYVVDLLRSSGLANIGAPPEPATGPGSSELAAARDGSSLMIAVAIVAVLGVVAVALAIRWRRSDAADQVDGARDRRGRTEQAVEVGLDALRREPDPRRAIIAAYAAMERSLSRVGLGRHPWEAPIEYLRRVLAEALGGGEDVQTMTHLFEVAKFSHHPVDESMRSGAIGALERIRSAAHHA